MSQHIRVLALRVYVIASHTSSPVADPGFAKGESDYGEREPKRGSGGGARGPGAEPLVRGQGGFPP